MKFSLNSSPSRQGQINGFLGHREVELMGRKKIEPLVNLKDSRGILLGRKMRSEGKPRIKEKGQVTVTRQEFTSFCCAHFLVVWIKCRIWSE